MGTQWFYKPTNSPRYPGGPVSGGPGGRNAFLTELATKSTLRAVGSGTWRGARGGQLGGTGLSPEEYKQRLSRLSRPTLSSSSRFDHPRLSYSYDNRTVSREGRYVWEKQDYFKDVHRCLWSRHGSVNHSYKLRGRPETSG